MPQSLINYYIIFVYLSRKIYKIFFYNIKYYLYFKIKLTLLHEFLYFNTISQ